MHILLKQKFEKENLRELCSVSLYKLLHDNYNYSS